MNGSGFHLKGLAGAGIELALAVALALIARSGIRRVRYDWTTVSSWRAAGLGSRQLASKQLHSIGGITSDGSQAVLVTVPMDTTKVVAFVVHAGSLPGELTLWDEVAGRIGGRSGVYLVGYCDSPACAKSLVELHRTDPFPVIGYAEYRTAAVMAGAGRAGVAILFDANLRRIGNVAWSSSSQPAYIARAVGGHE